MDMGHARVVRQGLSPLVPVCTRARARARARLARSRCVCEVQGTPARSPRQKWPEDPGRADPVRRVSNVERRGATGQYYTGSHNCTASALRRRPGPVGGIYWVYGLP